jgi:adenylate cyclase
MYDNARFALALLRKRDGPEDRLMVTWQSQSQPSRSNAASKSLRTAYIGIIALLVLIVLALAGGIIWYNMRKSTDLMVAAAEHQMEETGAKISDRIRLLYDPMYAIVGIASQAPDIKTLLTDDGPVRMQMLLRALRFYPQILALYVGFDDGELFSVNHIAGESRAWFRSFVGAPENAAFASRRITSGNDGVRVEHWVFLNDDGVEVGHTDPVPATFDPRQRPWYGPALHSDHVELSDLYSFMQNSEPGFTLSRSFHASSSGVFGADLAAKDLSDFLDQQRITPGSLSFIFTRSGEIVAYPDKARMAAVLPQNGRIMVALPQLSELKDPVAAGLFAAYRESSTPGSFVYRVAGRRYIGRVVEIPARYGRDQMLGIAVPLDEIEQPVIELRNQTLLYSLAFLAFTLPLYVTLIVFWIDRRLQGNNRRSGASNDD